MKGHDSQDATVAVCCNCKEAPQSAAQIQKVNQTLNSSLL